MDNFQILGQQGPQGETTIFLREKTTNKKVSVTRNVVFKRSACEMENKTYEQVG